MELRLGKRKRWCGGASGSRRPRKRDRAHFYEARAVTVDTAVILVARRLVDLRLSSELRLDWLDREAVALDPAVATPFANGFVDHDSCGRIDGLSALPLASLLGCARLV